MLKRSGLAGDRQKIGMNSVSFEVLSIQFKKPIFVNTKYLIKTTAFLACCDELIQIKTNNKNKFFFVNELRSHRKYS
jgi:hypothetical protein